MSKFLNIKKHKVLYIAIGILTTLAIFIFIYSLGRPWLPIFSTATEFNEPTYLSIDKENNLTALTDNHLQRITTFNNKQETEATTSFPEISHESNIYLGITKSNEKCFVVQAQYDNDSGYITKEEILYLNENLKTQYAIYSQDYSLFNDHIKSPRILDLRIDNDSLFFTKKSINECEIQTLKIDNINQVIDENKEVTDNINIIQKASLPFSDESVIDAKYNPVCNKTVFTSFFGAVYQVSDFNKLEIKFSASSEISFYGVCIDNDSNIYATDNIAFKVYKINENNYQLLDLNVDANLINICNNNLVVSDSKTNSVVIYNLTTMDVIKSISSTPYSPSMLLYSIAFSLSLIYILLIIVVLTIKGLIKIHNNAKPQIKKFYIFILLTIGIVLTLCITFVYISYTQIKEMQMQTLETLCYNISQTNGDEVEKLNDPTLNIDQKNKLYKEIMGNLEKYYYAYALGKGTYVDFDLYNKSNINKYFQSIDGENIDFSGIDDENLSYFNLFITSNADNNDFTVDYIHYGSNGKVEIYSGSFSDDEGKKIYACSPVYTTSNEFVGIVCVKSPVLQIIARQVQMGIQVCIIFLVALCTLSLLFIELFSHFKCFKKAKSIKKSESNGKTNIFGVRPMYFLMAFVGYIDSSYCVLITQDILNSSNIEYSDTLLGVPSSMYFIGGILGFWIAKVLISKFCTRNLQICSLLLMILSHLAIVFAVLNSNYVLYCLCKLIIGILMFITIYVLENTQFLTDDPKIQKTVVNDIALSIVSATALSGIVGGYLSQYLGNYSLYLFCIIIILINIFVTIYFVPKKVLFKNSQNTGDSTNTSLKEKNKIFNLNDIKLILKPQFLAVFILLIFVSILAYQYSPVIFPLLAKENGMSNTQIGDSILIFTCLVFIINSLLKKYLVSANQKSIAVCVLFIMGLSLMCFLINSSIIWILFTMLPILLGYRLTQSTYKLVWVPYANRQKIKKTSITFFILQMKELSKLIAPILVASMLSLGYIETCVIIGIITCLAALIFWLLNKNKKFL